MSSGNPFTKFNPQQNKIAASSNPFVKYNTQLTQQSNSQLINQNSPQVTQIDTNHQLYQNMPQSAPSSLPRQPQSIPYQLGYYPNQNYTADSDIQQKVNIARTRMGVYPILPFQPKQLLSEIQYINNPVFASIYDFASALSMGNGFPPEANMLAVITTSGQASQGRYFTEESGWYEKGVLNTVFLDESGTKKSFFFELFESPFRIFEDKKKEEYARIAPELLHRKKIAAIVEKKLHAEAAHATYKAIQANDEDIETGIQKYIKIINNYNCKSEAAVPRIFIGTGTAAKIAKELMLQGENLISISAEGGLLKQICKWKDKDLDLFLTSFTKEKWLHETDKGGIIELKNHSLSILANTQPKIIEDFFKNDDFIERGGMSRLLIYNTDAVEYTGKIDWNDEKFLSAKSIYEKKILSLLNQHYTQNQNRELFKIPVEPDAIGELKYFELENRNFVINNQTNLPIQLRSFSLKLHGTALRIAMLLHIWQHDSPCNYPISLEAVRCGIHIACWLYNHADRATHRQEIEAHKDRTEKLIHFLRSLYINRYPKTYITAREVQQKCRAVKESSSITLKYLRFLASLNYCQEIYTPKGHSCIFALHPSIYPDSNQSSNLFS